jgi:hypothetical protein
VLSALGVNPTDIDTLAFTHLHAAVSSASRQTANMSAQLLFWGVVLNAKP